jgi:hypothetical protein
MVREIKRRIIQEQYVYSSKCLPSKICCNQIPFWPNYQRLRPITPDLGVVVEEDPTTGDRIVKVQEFYQSQFTIFRFSRLKFTIQDQPADCQAQNS